MPVYAGYFIRKLAFADHSLWLNMNIHLAYTSVATIGFQENQLADILQWSRTYNSSVGITGVLLYVRGSFIQVLEGEKEAVESLFEHIRQDTRHTNVTLLLSRIITQRLFPDWAMGYTTITEHQTDEIQTILNLDYSGRATVERGDHLVLKMLKVFYDSNRYNISTTPHY